MFLGTLLPGCPGSGDLRRRWRLWERQMRSVGCWGVFFAMVAFYLPVVTAIQALLQVRQNHLRRFLNAPEASSFPV